MALRAATRARGHVSSTANRLLEATRRVERRHFWFVGLRSFVRPIVAESVAGQNGARILDCGCGTGANLSLLAGHGRAFGLEIASYGIELARQAGHRRLARASITAIPFADGAFDLVTAFDVLYSLSEAEEAAAISEMFRVLRRGGTLIVNVAALSVLRGNHSVFGAEVRRSTRRRLRAVLARGGFEVSRLTYTNATLFPLMLVVRVAQRLMGLATPEEAGTDLSLPPRPINAVLTAVLEFEALALRVVDMPIGSSLLCVARKPR